MAAISGSMRPACSEDPEGEIIQLRRWHTKLVGCFTEAKAGIPFIHSLLSVRACPCPEGIKTGKESPLPHVDSLGASSSLEPALAFGTNMATWEHQQGRTQIWSHSQKKWKLFWVGPGLIPHTMAQNFPPCLQAEPNSFEFQMSPFSSWLACAFSSVWTLSQPRQHLDPIWEKNWVSSLPNSCESVSNSVI